MSSIMRWRNGLMGLSSIAKAPVSHGVQNPMILRQSDASRCPGLQTPHADARRPPRERFSPSTLNGSVRQVLQRRSWLAGVMRLGGAEFLVLFEIVHIEI